MTEVVLDHKHVVINDGNFSDAFIRGIEKHLGKMSSITNERDMIDCGFTSEFVGFGGQSVWRGKIYRKEDRIVALELISNCDHPYQEVTMATMGLAVLTFNQVAPFADVIK